MFDVGRILRKMEEGRGMDGESEVGRAKATFKKARLRREKKAWLARDY